MAAPDFVMIGQRLGQFEITGKIGAGGMGVVYRARDTKLGREVALKVLPAAAIADPAARARLLEEARLASALNHPNICTIYEVNEEGGQTFAAMEYIAGRTLRAVIPAEGLPLELLVRYGAQIADAVSYAHDHRVVHRDIKSANVIVTPEGRVKVLDFGLARRVLDEADQETRGAALLAPAVAGTLHYLAPEVLRGELADGRSDIWAMGVVLFEMAAGRLPYDAASSYELTSAILRDPLPALPGRVPAGLRAIIQRCLEREPGQRYQRAGEVRAALEAIGSSDPAIAATTRSATAAPAVGSRRGMTLAAVAMVAIAMAWGVWSKWPRATGTPAGGSAGSSGEPRTSTGARASANPEANEYFEKGMHFLHTQAELPRARQMFERALQIDPKFAEARGWLGFSLMLEVALGRTNDVAWLYRAEEHVRQTLAEDPQNGHAHTTLAAVHYYRGRKDLMKEELDKALAINPNDFDAKMWLAGNYYDLLGDSATAMRMLQALAQEHPLLTVVRATYAEVLRNGGDMAASMREYEKVREQDPQSPFVLGLARNYLYTGDAARARKVMETRRPSDIAGFPDRLINALILAAEGKRREAEQQMDAEVLKFAALSPWFSMFATEYYAVMGMEEQALDWLDRCVRGGDERAEWFQRNPLLGTLREHPRFKQIIASILFQRQQRKPAKSS